jgi:uncharacterized protein YgfB (UPF0149 family)
MAEFSLNLMFRTSLKSSNQIQFCLKFDHANKNFTWTPTHIYVTGIYNRESDLNEVRAEAEEIVNDLNIITNI